jgi:hypothetical protein
MIDNISKTNSQSVFFKHFLEIHNTSYNIIYSSKKQRKILLEPCYPLVN